MLRSTQTAPPRTPRRARSTRWLPLVVSWQIVLVVVLALALQRQWLSMLVAAVVLLAALLLSLPVNGRTLLTTLRLRADFRRRAIGCSEAPDQTPDLVPLAQWVPRLVLTQIRDAHDNEIGVVADGDSWVGVLEISADNTLFTDRGAHLDLASMSGLARQDDVVFAGIQVVTLTVPAPSAVMLPAGSPALDAYRELSGAAAPPAVRRTWIALRLDPRLCLEAVARRGSGEVGVFATLRFGLHRAQALLKRGGVATEPLDSVALAEALALATGSSDDDGDAPRTREAWDAFTCDALVHRARAVDGFRDDPSSGYQRLLDVAADLPAMLVATSLTLAPGEPPRGAIRLVTPGADEAARADEALTSSDLSRLRLGPHGGVQVPGLLATVPLGRRINR